MAFKKGDEVICVINRPWQIAQGSDLGSDPKNGDKLLVAALHSRDGKIYLGFNEYPNVLNNSFVWYNSVWFRPIQYRSVGISKELAKSFTETLETSEVIKTEKEKAI